MNYPWEMFRFYFWILDETHLVYVATQLVDELNYVLYAQP